MRNGSVPPRRLKLQHTSNLEDVRSLSTRRLPVAVNDFIEGGAEDEVTLRRNRTGFESLAFTPRVLTDSGTRDQSTTILGTPVASPIVLAPVGLAALAHPEGERAAALAAADAGIVSTRDLAGVSASRLDELVDEHDLPFTAYDPVSADAVTQLGLRGFGAATRPHLPPPTPWPDAARTANWRG